MTRVSLFLLALLGPAACAATPSTAELEPSTGVTGVVARPGGWTLEVPGGIGRFRLRLPDGARAGIDLSYAEGRPFTRLQGARIDGRSVEEGRLAAYDGVARVRLVATTDAHDLTVVVIDYYR